MYQNDFGYVFYTLRCSRFKYATAPDRIHAITQKRPKQQHEQLFIQQLFMSNFRYSSICNIFSSGPFSVYLPKQEHVSAAPRLLCMFLFIYFSIQNIQFKK